MTPIDPPIDPPITLPRDLLRRLCTHADGVRCAARAVISDLERGHDGDTPSYQAWLGHRDGLNAALHDLTVHLLACQSASEWAPHAIRLLTVPGVPGGTPQ